MPAADSCPGQAKILTLMSSHPGCWMSLALVAFESSLGTIFLTKYFVYIPLCCVCGESGGQVGLCTGPWSKSPWRRSYLMPSHQCNDQHKHLKGTPEPTVPWQSVTRRFEGRKTLKEEFILIWVYTVPTSFFCQRINDFNSINQLWFHLLLY